VHRQSFAHRRADAFVAGTVLAFAVALAPAEALAQAPKAFTKPKPAADVPVAAQCDGIQILTIDISGRDAEAYCKYAVAERAKVEAYWGATWTEPIRIHVDRGYSISRALVPGHFGNRGFMEMPLKTVLGRNSALLHEIVHVYAPNANRFLAEGFATWLHHRLAGNPAYPNFGRNLNGLARSQSGSLAALDAVRTPTPLATVMYEPTAYILAASFVGFLIETDGLAKFRALYDGGGYDQVYGRPLEALEKDWRAWLARQD
jgi:hypothetical protein